MNGDLKIKKLELIGFPSVRDSVGNVYVNPEEIYMIMPMFIPMGLPVHKYLDCSTIVLRNGMSVDVRCRTDDISNEIEKFKKLLIAQGE